MPRIFEGFVKAVTTSSTLVDGLFYSKADYKNGVYVHDLSMTFVAKNHRQKSVRTNGSSRFATNTEQSLSLSIICQAHAHFLKVLVVSRWTHSKNIHGNCPMNLISMCQFCGLIIHAYKTYTAPFVHPSIDAFILSFFWSLSIHPFIYHFIH